MNTIEEKIETLARPNIRALKPYSSARDEAPEASRGQSRIMLDANENSFGGPLQEDYSRYPDPQQKTLKAALAALKGVDPAQIFLGNGSDEAIDVLFRAFVEPGADNVVLMPPTYGMYAVQANIHHAAIRYAPLRPDFSPDAALVQVTSDAHAKLLFLCSPNNPTGQCLPEDFVLEMLETFPGLVVVDEAYVDFSAKASWTTKLLEFPNLVVLQTLSKAWGLAGIRLGAAFAHPAVIQLLNKVKYPYNLNTLTIQAAEKALLHVEKMRHNVLLILAERERLAAALQQLPAVKTVFPSEANFLLVRVHDAVGMYHHLARNGVIVRDRSRELHCDNCLRITVGREEENDKLLECLSV